VFSVVEIDLLIDLNILAAGFVTPAFFIAGVALASIPIIIHILNRRRYRIVDWAAMTFLLQALRKNRRRLRFEQWLLLAVRCCVLLFLGLALARPLGCEDSTLASLAARRAGLHVIVLDNSYSMTYEADRPEAKTHLDQAKLLAKRMIDRLAAGGEAVSVITTARPAQAVIAQPTYDLQAAKVAIDRVEQSFGGTDLLGALTRARDIGREGATQPNRRLYLFTDGTRSAWEVPEEETLESLGRDLDRIFDLVHFNLGRPGQWNHAVLEVKPARELVRAGFPNDLQAVIRGFGNGPDASIQWRLDDQPLPGGGTIRPALDTPTQTQSRAQIKDGGQHVVSVALGSDNRLKVDDTRTRVIDVASELKVLIVEGERGIGPMAGSGAFLNIALAPPSDDGQHTSGGRFRTSSYVMPELISDLEFGSKVLGDYRAVILAGVSQISAHQADQLQKFVEQGGTLMLFMGEPVSGENYNQALLPRGLMPGPLTKRVSAQPGESFHFEFNPSGVLHPYLSIFRDNVKTGIDTTQIFTYWQVELPPDTKAQRVLNYRADDKGRQDPAITVHDLAQGRVVFVSTTANADWTLFPAKPAYLALLHEMLAGSVSSGDRWLNLSVGESLQIPPSIQLTATPTLKDAQQADVVLDQKLDNNQPVYRSRPLAKPGLYTLFTGARKIPVAVNVPDDEADIRTLDNTAIRSALGDIDITLADDQLPALDTQQAGNDFGWSFMLVVLGLVGLECFLAMRFGHYKR
jgi:Mg-chelatase subunit ChlD